MSTETVQRPPLGGNEGHGSPTRAFLVGCPRSGTTLLQSMLFGHPDVVSFPETFFFVLSTAKGRLRRNLGLRAGGARRAFDKLEELDLGHFEGRVPIRLRGCARDFVSALDTRAICEGKSTWIEKTPVHLRYCRYIERCVPDPRFIHIVRGGAGAIPALREVTQRFPDAWGGERSLDQCIARWREDVRLSARKAGRANHAFVSYERLASDPEAVLVALCDFLSVQVDPPTVEGMLEGRGRRLARVVDEEPWKSGVGGELTNRDAEKLTRRLSSSERERVLAAVEQETATLARIHFL